MSHTRRVIGSVAWLLVAMTPAMAAAQAPAVTTNSSSLPEPQSTHEAPPPVSKPVLATGESGGLGITTQAGIGGTQAYGRAGVLELGGSAGFRGASGQTQINFDPSVGYFFIDNLEASVILGIDYARVKSDNVTISGTLFRALLEPSFHLPFTPSIFGFLGLGVGVAHAPVGTGFALAPRLGANILVGRSGIFTPAFSVDYSSVSIAPSSGVSGVSTVGVTTTYGLNLGYTVMW